MGVKIAKNDDSVFRMFGVAMFVSLNFGEGHGWEGTANDFLDTLIVFLA